MALEEGATSLKEDRAELIGLFLEVLRERTRTLPGPFGGDAVDHDEEVVEVVGEGRAVAGLRLPEGELLVEEGLLVGLDAESPPH